MIASGRLVVSNVARLASERAQVTTLSKARRPAPRSPKGKLKLCRSVGNGAQRDAHDGTVARFPLLISRFWGRHFRRRRHTIGALMAPHAEAPITTMYPRRPPRDSWS
jgi:hypothetical protein